MAHRTEQRVIPETVKTVVVETTCDLCGMPINPKYGDALRTEIRLTTGMNYPEGGSGEEWEYDICASCFRSVLMPFLESKGAKPRHREWDF